jgi:regulation of enolase protein 1 (concanavalin A-like superfamily)
MIREVHNFGTGEEKQAKVGVMTCSPLGKGALGTYKNFTVREGVREE